MDLTSNINTSKMGILVNCPRDLILESATRSLEIRAPQRINIESSAGDVTASCLSQLRFLSKQGEITFESHSIYLKGLKYINFSLISTISGKHQSTVTTKSEGITVYQLCSCANGKLFLALPDGICQADVNLC